ncbi:MAG: hypothetical protein ACLQFT_03975 [Steroidobacteraceae bacterium]
MDSLSVVSLTASIFYFLYRLAHLPEIALGEDISERYALVKIISKYAGPSALCPSCGKTACPLPRQLIPHFHEGDYVPSWVVYPQGICAECCERRFWPPLRRTLLIVVTWYWLCVALRLTFVKSLGLSVDSLTIWAGLMMIGSAPIFILERMLMTSRDRRDYESRMREEFLDTVTTGGSSLELSKMKEKVRCSQTVSN